MSDRKRFSALSTKCPRYALATTVAPQPEAPLRGTASTNSVDELVDELVDEPAEELVRRTGRGTVRRTARGSIRRPARRSTRRALRRELLRPDWPRISDPTPNPRRVSGRYRRPEREPGRVARSRTLRRRSAGGTRAGTGAGKPCTQRRPARPHCGHARCRRICGAADFGDRPGDGRRVARGPRPVWSRSSPARATRRCASRSATPQRALRHRHVCNWSPTTLPVGGSAARCRRQEARTRPRPSWSISKSSARRST